MTLPGVGYGPQVRNITKTGLRCIRESASLEPMVLNEETSGEKSASAVFKYRMWQQSFEHRHQRESLDIETERHVIISKTMGLMEKLNIYKNLKFDLQLLNLRTRDCDFKTLFRISRIRPAPSSRPCSV